METELERLEGAKTVSQLVLCLW